MHKTVLNSPGKWIKCTWRKTSLVYTSNCTAVVSTPLLGLWNKTHTAELHYIVRLTTVANVNRKSWEVGSKSRHCEALWSSRIQESCWNQLIKSGWNQWVKSGWNTWRFHKMFLVGSMLKSMGEIRLNTREESGWNACGFCKLFSVGSNGWNHVKIYGWTVVEIHVDFANCFKLDPTSEIRLNPMGEITMKYILTLQIILS